MHKSAGLQQSHSQWEHRIVKVTTNQDCIEKGRLSDKLAQPPCGNVALSLPAVQEAVLVTGYGVVGWWLVK